MLSGILSLLGLKKVSKLLDKRAYFLTQDLAEEADETGHGHASVKIPFLLRMILRRPINQITVITDPELARKIIAHRLDDDPNARIPFMGFDRLFGTSSMLARATKTAIDDRKALKGQFFNSENTFKEVLAEEMVNWRKEASSNTIDIKASLNKRLLAVLGRVLLGLETLPPDNDSDFSLNNLMGVIDELDIAAQNGDLQTCLVLKEKLDIYSKWLYENNKQGIGDKPTILPHLLNTQCEIEYLNFATTLIVTTNLTRLVYLSAIFFASSPFWQNKLRTAYQQDPKELTKFYEESCRLFTSSIIPRYTSKDITVDDHVFPKGTLFEFLVRKMRMNPDVFQNPLSFNPYRIQFNKTKSINEAKEYSPFGFGQRRCPAAGQFSKKFWMQAMREIFFSNELKLADGKKMEEISVDVPCVVLATRYHAQLTGIEKARHSKTFTPEHCFAARLK